MDKSEDQKTNRSELAKNRPVWDCGSSLYDSFELKSFNRQLDSAISARTLSMPHLSDRQHSRTRSMPHLPDSNIAPAPQTAASEAAKKSRKISRSLNKLLRSLFRMKPQSAAGDSSLFRVVQDRPREEFYAVQDKSGALSAIPEGPEIHTGANRGGLSPELKPLARRTVSDRFTVAAAIGISCA